MFPLGILTLSWLLFVDDLAKMPCIQHTVISFSLHLHVASSSLIRHMRSAFNRRISTLYEHLLVPYPRPACQDAQGDLRLTLSV